jgi:hypothetical protein
MVPPISLVSPPRGWPGLVPGCARRTINIMVGPRLLVASQGWGLIDLPLRATFSPAHPLADIFHPPHPPIASQSISRDVPLAQARVFRDRALREHNVTAIVLISPAGLASNRDGGGDA